MSDDQRDILRMALQQMEEKKGLVWGPEWMEEVAAALRAMLAENAALKAHDPLAEMWAALAEYQPFADRDGHGESWRRMCSWRSQTAACHAAQAAREFSREAAWYASYAVREAAQMSATEAIAAVRRAKEAR
jgi:hypothetical protein